MTRQQVIDAVARATQRQAVGRCNFADLLADEIMRLELNAAIVEDEARNATEKPT